MRAAQYVRMSTEHQQYSIANQLALISEYANLHGFEIVRSYSDEGKSGLDLAHRPGLRQLLDDVIRRDADFTAVLVYDVSRWGRFQDADESAHYEFICKQSGIRVHYCAEPFTNDDNIYSSLIKTLKRTMAGEYSRELSAKTFAAQRRLTNLGFKMGGPAGYALRRVLLSPEGVPERELGPGEWKYMSDQHVVMVLGTQQEVSIVRRIFSMYLDEGTSVSQIVEWLNRQGIAKGNGYPWSAGNIRKILTDPKYAGCSVFARTARKLRSKGKLLPREQWIVQPNSFDSIVSLDMVERARKKLSSRFLSSEKIVEDLRSYIEHTGSVSLEEMHPRNGLPFGSTFRKRFGSILRAYELAGVTPDDVFLMRNLQVRGRFIRSCAAEQFRRAILAKHPCFHSRKGRYQISGYGEFQFEVARCFQTKKQGLCWVIYCRPHPESCPCAIARLQPDNIAVKDWCSLKSYPQNTRRFTFRDNDIRQNGAICNSADELLSVLTKG